MPVFFHLLSIAHGVAASLAFFLALHLAGRAVTPRRWDSTLGRGATPSILGAAIYVLTCWYGIRAGIRLTPLVTAFAGATLALSAVRASRTRSTLRRFFVTPSAGWWLGLFTGLYALAYLFTLPPATGEQLPIAWLGNIDLLYYLDYAAYLLRLGTVSYPTISTEYFAYFQTPGAFHLLGGFSLLFGMSPMRALMPAQFALAAAAGLLSALIARSVFRTSRLGAAVVAAATVSAPFYRYIAGNYYLSSLITLPVLLHLLLTVVRRQPDGRLVSLPLVCAFFAHDALLFFIYPFLFLVSVPFQVAAIGLRAIALHLGAGVPGRTLLRLAAGLVTASALGLVGVTVCAPLQTAWALRMIRDLSHPGVAGWTLNIISPAALLGLPVSLRHIDAAGSTEKYWAIAGIWVVVILAMAAFGRPGQTRAASGRRTFYGLACLGFLIYGAYFSVVGASYQQWKLASYVAMPFSFVFITAVVGLVESRLRAKGPAPGARFGGSSVVALAGLALVGGNLAVHAAADPELRRFSGRFEKFARVAAMPFRELSIDATDHLALLSVYYLPGKRLHFTGPNFGYVEPLSLAAISPARPLFLIDYDCVGVGHVDTLPVDGLGCLLFQPPSLLMGADYPFSRTYLFIDQRGLGLREDWGRWNSRGTVELALTADQRRIRLDEAAYLNLELQPCLVPGLRAQRIRIGWGAGRRAEALLGEREWISLPLRGSDWAGEWVSTQTVSLELPDIVPPHWVDGRYRETRPLAVGFVSLSVSVSPRGRTVTPLP